MKGSRAKQNKPKNGRRRAHAAVPRRARPKSRCTLNAAHPQIELSNAYRNLGSPSVSLESVRDVATTLSWPPELAPPLTASHLAHRNPGPDFNDLRRGGRDYALAMRESATLPMLTGGKLPLAKRRC